jgi:hypothetical protein
MIKNNPGIIKTNKKEITKYIGNDAQQNYFQFEQKHYKQNEGLTIGSATSAILAVEYIQYMGHKQLYRIL